MMPPMVVVTAALRRAALCPCTGSHARVAVQVSALPLTLWDRRRHASSASTPCRRGPPPPPAAAKGGDSSGPAASAAPALQRRRLDVAIVGAPNAGKSQLLNTLTGATVAAVSRKRHTTRSGILGARTVDDTQLVFVDTPGFMRYKSARKEGLTRELMVRAEAEVEGVDYTLVVIDAAKRLDDDLREALVTLMLRAAASRGRVEANLDEEPTAEAGSSSNGGMPPPYEEEVREKFAIVLNKVDLVNPKNRLLDIATDVGKMGDECVRYAEKESPTYQQDGEEGDKDAAVGEEKEKEMVALDLDPRILEALYPPVFFVSALKDDGVNDILRHLLSRATPSGADWPVPPGEASLMTPLERIEEVIREKIYRCLHREVPHRVTQVNRVFRTMRRHGGTGEKVVRIDQDLVVRTESHRRLVTGRGGMTLKRIEEGARRDLRKAFQCEVVLNLHVKFSKSRHNRDLDGERLGVVQRNL